MGPLARKAARLGPADALVVCFERLDEPNTGEDLVRCVALPGPLPGLSLDPNGSLWWHRRAPEHCLVMVSADRQLVLWRPVGSAAVRLCREGRALDLPEERVVIALDQDLVVVDGARLRVHLHGPARRIHPPFRVRLARAASAATVAASLGVGGSAAVTMTGCGRPDPSGASGPSADAASTRSEALGRGADAGPAGDGAAPPAAQPMGADHPPTDGGAPPAGPTATPSASAATSASASAPSATAPRRPPTKRPIEVRKRPPVYWDG